jgi:type I restriction enzyme S subunit
MNKQLTLNQAAFYSEDRINGSKVSRDSFVTTDSMLQDKNGISTTPVLPKGSLIAFSEGDILVGNIRPYLKKIWQADKKGGCSPDVLVLKAKPGIDPIFLYYSLFRDDFFNHMMKGSKGTKMPRGDKNQILRFHIPEIDFADQQSIAAILSSLDKKIALNHRINEELESMAQMIYNYWFVQFDFPDKKGKPYKSSGGTMRWSDALKREIPNDWSDGSLLSLGEIIGGSTPPREVADYFTSDGIAWITPRDLAFNTRYKFITKGESDVSDMGIKAASLNIMPAGTILLSSRAPIGYLAIATEKVTTNQGFKSFVPNKGFSTEFIYYTVKSMIPAIENNAVGSTFKEVSATTLKSIPICLPDNLVLKSYSDIVDSIFKRQSEAEREIKQLCELRDWLLPMLMNQQVKASGKPK